MASTSGNIKNDGTVTAAGKGGVCIPTTEKNAQFRRLKAIRENMTCFDWYVFSLVFDICIKNLRLSLYRGIFVYL